MPICSAGEIERKAQNLLPGRGSTVPQRLVKEMDTDVPPSEKRQWKFPKHCSELRVPLGRRTRWLVVMAQCEAAIDRHYWMRRTISMLSHVTFGKVERNALLGGWAMGKRITKKLIRTALRNLLRKELS